MKGCSNAIVLCPVPRDLFFSIRSWRGICQLKKVMVFFSSRNKVKFHSELLRYIQVDCLDIHGKQKQLKRTNTFFNICKAEKGILLCTDRCCCSWAWYSWRGIFLFLTKWRWIHLMSPTSLGLLGGLPYLGHKPGHTWTTPGWRIHLSPDKMLSKFSWRRRPIMH